MSVFEKKGESKTKTLVDTTEELVDKKPPGDFHCILISNIHMLLSNFCVFTHLRLKHTALGTLFGCFLLRIVS